MDKAWMLRNDGKQFPVLQHIYADISSPEETVAAAEWLYNATARKDTQKAVLNLISVWAMGVLGDRCKRADNEAEREEYFKRIISEIKQRPYRFLSENFVKQIYRELDFSSDRTLAETMKEVELCLNQEFLRVRYGGLYNSMNGCQDLYCRISSADFDWYPFIKNFVIHSVFPIRTITIVRDEESTGAAPCSFYRTSDGTGIYDHMQIKEFLADKKTKKKIQKNKLSES